MRLEMKYFVVKPHPKTADDIFARASQHAMLAYADCIEAQEPEFAAEIRAWAERESLNQYKAGNKGKTNGTKK